MSFVLGRETAKPSLTRAITSNFASGPVVDLITGALYDAKILVDKARLNVCLADSEKLELANKDLATRLGAFESRLQAARESNSAIREELQKNHEVTKELADRLYSTECEEWANQPVCPAVRDLLQ